jgi:GntR family transcriptional regulator, transcriptional repressor for pyruvate dehydrogenase complex
MSIKKITESYSAAGGTLFQPLPEKRTFKEIAEQIRSSIYANTLKPGDKLPSERELAVQFKVGRISVREALRMLEQAGLIFIKQGSNGGAYVKEADTSVITESVYDLVWRSDIRLEDLTEARLAVEKQILQNAFNKITENDLKMLGECVEEMEKITSEKIDRDIPIHYEVSKFHLVLARATKNPVFEILLKVLVSVTAKVLDLKLTDMERLKKHFSSHKAIYQAIKSHDLDMATEAMEKHMLDIEYQYSGVINKRKHKMKPRI